MAEELARDRQIDVDAASEDVDHLIASKERLQLGMGRQ